MGIVKFTVIVLALLKVILFDIISGNLHLPLDRANRVLIAKREEFYCKILLKRQKGLSFIDLEKLR